MMQTVLDGRHPRLLLSPGLACGPSRRDKNVVTLACRCDGRHDIAPIPHGAWIALHIHVSRFQDRHCDRCHRPLLVVGPFCRNDGCMTGEHKAEAWMRHQVRLKLGAVNVERPVKSQGCCQ